MKLADMTEAEAAPIGAEITEAIEGIIDALPDNPGREAILEIAISVLFGLMAADRANTHRIERLAAAVPEPEAPPDHRPVQVSVEAAIAGYSAKMHVPGFGDVYVCYCGTLHTGGQGDCKACRVESRIS